MTVNQDKFEYTHSLHIGETEFHVREMIPGEEKERMAQDFVGASVLFDEETGIAYEGYNAALIRTFLILAHYTDLELSEYDNPQGRYAVYDAIATHGLWDEILQIVEKDMCDVDEICWRLESSARETFARRHSLDYRLGKLFEGLLGTENLTETIAHAEGLNNKLVEMLAAYQEKKPTSAAGGLRFDKRQTS